MLEIAERILYFNQLNRSRQGLKILTPHQMFSRLPITLAQLKTGNNSKKLRQLLYYLYRSKKNLQKISIKLWLAQFKHRNNLYEY